MAEEVLVNVVIDSPDAQAKVDNLTRSITTLTSENKKLIDANKELEKSGKANTQEYLDNARQIEANKVKIQENTASRKGLTQAIIAEDNSIKSLRVQNAELIKQRDQINSKTTDGKARIQAINKQIDENNKSIKENVSGLEKQKMSVGDYTGALDKMVPGLGATVNGIKDFTAAGLKLIATPLGLILLAIAAALATVAQFFTRTTAGIDLMEDAMTGITTTINVFLDRLAIIGEGLVDIFSGNITTGIEKMTGAFDGMGKEIAKETQVAIALNNTLRELEDREIAHGIAVSKSENEIKKLIIQAKNRNITDAERIKLLNQALTIEKKNTEDLINIKRGQLAVEAKLAGQTKNINQEKGESEMEYAERLIESGLLIDEVRNNLIDKIKAVNEAEGASLVLQEKIINQIDLENQKMAEKARKEDELREKTKQWVEATLERLAKDKTLTEEEKKNLDERVENMKVATTAQLTLSTTAAQSMAKLSNELTEQVKQNDRDQLKSFTEVVQAKSKLFFEENAAQIAAVMATGDVIADINSKITETRKHESEIQIQNVQLQQQAELKALQEKLDKGEISEEEFKEAKEEIEKRAARDIDEIKRKAFEANKKNRIVDSVLDTIQSGIAAFRALVGIPIVGPALAAAAAAAALAFGYKQVDLIRKEEYVPASGFASGGEVKAGTFVGPSDENGGRGIEYIRSDGRHRIRVGGGENFYVLNRTASDKINALSALNVSTGGRSFFVGGRTPLPHFAAGGQVVAGSSLAAGEIESIVQATMKNMPPIITVVQDVTEAQAIQVQIEDAANLLQ